MKTVKTKLIIVACVLPLLFMACGKDNEPNPPTVNNAPITFVKLGNRWDYVVFENGINYGISTITLVSEENNRFGVLYNEDNNWCFTISTFWYGDGEYWKIYPHSLYVDTTASIQLHRNSYVGQKWTYKNILLGFTELPPIETKTEEIYEVLSVSETVTVPAGTFTNCIKIKYQIRYDYGQIDNWIYWIHKDFGLIKSVNVELGLERQLHSKNF